MITGELYWDDPDETGARVAECFPSGNIFRVSLEQERWRLEADVGDTHYDLRFDDEKKAYDLAEELQVQSLLSLD